MPFTKASAAKKTRKIELKYAPKKPESKPNLSERMLEKTPFSWIKLDTEHK